MVFLTSLERINRDVRSLKKSAKIESHSDEIAGVCANPVNKEMWLSCGTDDLMCLYNMSEADRIESSNPNLSIK